MFLLLDSTFVQIKHLPISKQGVPKCHDLFEGDYSLVYSKIKKSYKYVF